MNGQSYRNVLHIVHQLQDNVDNLISGGDGVDCGGDEYFRNTAVSLMVYPTMCCGIKCARVLWTTQKLSMKAP